jgi:hypothetical protein
MNRIVVLRSGERRKRSLRSELEKRSMDGLADGGAEVLEMPLRAFC